MLVRLLTPDDILLDDPVRPSISPKERLSPGRWVNMYLEDGQIGAIVCWTYRCNIPTTEAELLSKEMWNDDKIKLILYSIWSYKKGCGRKLVEEMLSFYGKYDTRIITLSPKTEMAERFHLSNGAVLLKTNEETVNYEY